MYFNKLNYGQSLLEVNKVVLKVILFQSFPILSDQKKTPILTLSFLDLVYGVLIHMECEEECGGTGGASTNAGTEGGPGRQGQIQVPGCSLRERCSELGY